MPAQAIALARPQAIAVAGAEERLGGPGNVSALLAFEPRGTGERGDRRGEVALFSVVAKHGPVALEQAGLSQGVRDRERAQGHHESSKGQGRGAGNVSISGGGGTGRPDTSV